MKYLKTKWAALGAVIIAVAVLAAFSFGRSPKPQYFTAKAETGDIHDVVEATGTIDAVTTVQVGSQVSGTISKLFADFNSRVKKGQIIAELDPSLFQGALLQAQADYQNAQANYAAAKASLIKAQATAEQTTQDYARNVALAKEGVISSQALDAAKANADANKAAVNAAQAQVNQAAAQVKQKVAAVEVAKTNLDHTIIRAPIDGVVTARNVDVGQTVAASLQAPVLFNIAQDLTKMRVYAKTDESDVGQIKAGQPITFTVDAFPRDSFRGTVEQVRMNPTTVQNVVTYDTVISFDNPEMKLFPGMTAYVTIPVANAQSVVKIPNGALRFTPDLTPDQIRALYAKFGIKAPAGRGGGQQGSAQRASEQPAAQQQVHAAPDKAIVWKLTSDRQLEPVQLRTGITDHTYTELAQVLAGSLKQGDELAIGAATGGQKSGSGSPNMMRGMGR
jgi:HlyD family secretion protein